MIQGVKDDLAETAVSSWAYVTVDHRELGEMFVSPQTVEDITDVRLVQARDIVQTDVLNMDRIVPEHG